MLYLFAFRLFKAPSLAVAEKQVTVLFLNRKVQATFVVSAKGYDDPSHEGAHSVESTLVR
jgi:hypothetical protein